MMREIGAYRIMEPLSQGGTGILFKAEHSEDPTRSAALKLLRPGLARNPGFPAVFLRECRQAGAIDHPSVARLYDAGEAGGFLFMAREYVDGTELGKLLKEKGSLAEEQVIGIGRDLASALTALAGSDLLHRGLSPSNVIITTAGKARIGGIGIGRAMTSDTMPRPVLPLGRLAYMAPEQVKGLKDIDVRADLYSLGMTLYTALTGVCPTVGGTAQETVMKIFMETIPDPRQFVPSLNPALCTLIVKLVQRERERRPTNPAEVMSELDSVTAAGSAMAAKPAPAASAAPTKGAAPAAPAPAAVAAPPPKTTRTMYFRGKAVEVPINEDHH